jgi:hypothetical protein
MESIWVESYNWHAQCSIELQQRYYLININNDIDVFIDDVLTEKH